MEACSGARNPVTSEMSTPDNHLLLTQDTGEREIVAVYDMTVDQDAKTVRLNPSDRTGAFHFPLTSIYPDTLKIIGMGWTPSFFVTLQLTHPFPGSGIDAFDPRVIAILPATGGVDCFYPIFSVQANHSIIKENDGYTKLYDNLGGSIEGNTNPFKAYFKNQPYRIWSSTGTTSEAQRWYLDLNGFGGKTIFKFVVDVSTNYPSPPTPVTDNAPEPVEIKASIGEGLTSQGGTATIDVTFLDWQGYSDIKCKVEAPDLFNSAIELFYSRPGSNPNEYVFTGNISNSKLAPIGSYDMLIAVWDIPSDIHVFKEVQVYVESAPPYPVDVTPPWLQCSPRRISRSGNYALILSLPSIASLSEVHIYDVSNPLSPVWINKVPLPRYAWSIDALDGYAYVANDDYGLRIIDIDPPESAYICKTVSTTENIDDVSVSNGFAYITGRYRDDSLTIIDIDPPENASVINKIPMQFPETVFALDGYAYVGCRDSFSIVDVDPPESASIVNTIGITIDNSWAELYVSNGYAYLANVDAGLLIMDIDPPESAQVVQNLSLPDSAYDVFVSGNYAYLANGSEGLQIIDVQQPAASHIEKTIDTSDSSLGVHVSTGYAYMANSYSMQVIDIEPPSSAYIAKSVYMLDYVQDLQVSNAYAYVVDYWGAFHIINIQSPENAYILKSVPLEDTSWIEGLCVANGYAYLACCEDVLYIIDIEPPETAHVVKSIAMPDWPTDVDVENGYAFVSDYRDGGLQIVDVDPPESAVVVNSVDTPGHCAGVDVSNGYAYVGDGWKGLMVIDVDPVADAHQVKTVISHDWYNSADEVHVSGDYAYVAGKNNSMWIVDITPPESAYIANVVDTPNEVQHIYVLGSIAYVANYVSGLTTIDIMPSVSAYVMDSFDTPDRAESIDISGDYAYVGDDSSGLRIIKLW